MADPPKVFGGRSSSAPPNNGVNMQPKTDGMPAVVGIVFGIIWFLLMGGMAVAYVIMLKAGWRLMKAHEKIAEKIAKIADK